MAEEIAAAPAGGVAAERIGLRARELGAPLHLAQALFAGRLEFLGAHPDVVLRETAVAVLGEKGTVTAFENVELWIRQLRILRYVVGAVNVADEFGPVTHGTEFGQRRGKARKPATRRQTGERRCSHQGRSVGRILAMEYQHGVLLGAFFKQLRCQALLVIMIGSALDMPALILVLEATVNNDDFLVIVLVLSINNFNESRLVDTRQTISLVIRQEMWQTGLLDVISGSQRLQRGRSDLFLLFFILLYHIVSTLKHAEGPTAVLFALTRTRKRVGGLANGLAGSAEPGPTGAVPEQGLRGAGKPW